MTFPWNTQHETSITLVFCVFFFSVSIFFYVFSCICKHRDILWNSILTKSNKLKDAKWKLIYIKMKCFPWDKWIEHTVFQVKSSCLLFVVVFLCSFFAAAKRFTVKKTQVNGKNKINEKVIVVEFFFPFHLLFKNSNNKFYAIAAYFSRHFFYKLQLKFFPHTIFSHF